ncbi:AAA family ATPase [Acaryochloris marina]|uniref:ATPase, AAA family protein n=1 Tax=Acaryochloris marina (strain MBIC 11017) TaxID=329726 RepID=A8ZQB4_ACAM1|nr:MoxR family ATPase [Acaryochloris marina]ABW33200.1 ATPase, AAA family protein [Acaryochloris marina MBIC11017]
MSDWKIFKGDRQKKPMAINSLPAPPPWRSFTGKESVSSTQKERRGKNFYPREDEIEMVNAALYLRRPLLVTGKPGTGKTSLAYAITYELDLGEVLTWSITTRSTLSQGLYSYDAVGRLQDAKLQGQDSHKRLGKYLRLGPLGTALLPTDKPRVLLIDEIDKSDIDFPNDLLHVFEDGEYVIEELARIADEAPTIDVQTALRDEQEESYQETVSIHKGLVRCTTFPLVIMTSNGERDFPPAFLRRCLRLDMGEPTPERLRDIIEAQLGKSLADEAGKMIDDFDQKRRSGDGDLATDQLLNAVYLIGKEGAPEKLKEQLLQYLNR